MNSGKAFELLIKRILINIGFSEVKSDGVYIYDGAAGQMIQGLGEAHNADVLLEPPVQTPFYSKSRLLIECKNYKQKVNLNIVRSALGLREDINNFNVIDIKTLEARRRQRRPVFPPKIDCYSYQVAVASFNGFTTQAQEFASAHRIPLIEFNKLPFWADFCREIEFPDSRTFHNQSNNFFNENLLSLADKIGHSMAVAITNSGQMLFLLHKGDGDIKFNHNYSLHWNSTNPQGLWILKSGAEEYQFQLPIDILKNWLSGSLDEVTMKREAINCKTNYMANMIVYFTHHEQPSINMISIEKSWLDAVKKQLEEHIQ